MHQNSKGLLFRSAKSRLFMIFLIKYFNQFSIKTFFEINWYVWFHPDHYDNLAPATNLKYRTCVKQTSIFRYFNLEKLFIFL